MDNVQINPIDAYFLTLNSKTTVQSYTFRLRSFCKFAFKSIDFDRCEWEKLTYIDVLKFMQYQQELGLAHTSINVTLSALKSIAFHCWQLNLIDTDSYLKIKTLKNIKGRRAPAGRVLDSEEIATIKRMIGNAGDRRSARDFAIFAVSIGAGLRRRELMLLNISDVLGSHIVIQGKGNKVRLVLITPFTKQAIVNWLKYRNGQPDEPLFVRIFPNGSLGDRLGILSMHRTMIRIAKRAEMQPFTTHDLRRTYATTLIDAGADKFAVQRLMGHASLKTTEIYDRRGERANDEAMGLLKY